MKRKGLIAVNLALLEDKKVNKIYLDFREKITTNIGKEKFAIAVSGGTDSLSLSILAKLYSLENKNKFIALIVDHGLRKESAKEAKETLKNLLKNNINAKILTYSGQKFSSNIQKRARDLRYDLMQNFCKKNNIKYLILAHHQEDLIENFYIRLVRGSGIKGLTSLEELTQALSNFYIVRPLLNFSKLDLIYITKKIYRSWIEDPSNVNDKFLRVRIRKFQNKLKKEGFNTSRIIKTINNLNYAKKSLDFYILKSEKKYLNFFKEGYASLNYSIFNNEAQEIIFRVFIKALHYVSGEYYPPRSENLTKLIKNISLKQFKSATLGGCLVEKNKNIINFFREERNMSIVLLNKQNLKKIWDDRFVVVNKSSIKSRILVKKLGKEGLSVIKQYKFQKKIHTIPTLAIKTLPSFWNLKNELLFVPFINFTNNKLKVKKDSFDVNYLRFN